MFHRPCENTRLRAATSFPSTSQRRVGSPPTKAQAPERPGQGPLTKAQAVCMSGDSVMSLTDRMCSLPLTPQGLSAYLQPWCFGPPTPSVSVTLWVQGPPASPRSGNTWQAARRLRLQQAECGPPRCPPQALRDQNIGTVLPPCLAHSRLPGAICRLPTRGGLPSFHRRGVPARCSGLPPGPAQGLPAPGATPHRCPGQVSIHHHQADVKLKGAAVIWTITVTIIASSP